MLGKVPLWLKKSVSVTGGHASEWCWKNTVFVVAATDGGNRTPLILPLSFSSKYGVMPTDLTVRVAASYLTSKNEPRTAQTT